METRMLGEVLKSPGKTIRDIKKGMVFAYPTDTVYGLGCNALEEGSVRRIRAIKGSARPFSVIAPSREWIENNLIIKCPEYLDRLPGPYTLVFRKRRKSFLRPASPGGNLGVRIPSHPFTRLVQEAGVPFITTSANISGDVPPRVLSGMPVKIREGADVAIDGGPLGKKPSSVMDLTGKRPSVLRGNEART
jgi:L-threonylcarbamoyladenylate synthase